MGLLGLVATLGLDVLPFERGIDRATSKAKQKLGDVGRTAGESIKGNIAAMFGAAAVEEFARRTVNAMVRIKDASEQFGIPTDEVQRLDKAANDVGLTFEDFGSILTHMGATRKAAIEDNERMRQSFENLGGAAEDVKGPMSDLELLLKMAESRKGKQFTPSLHQDMREVFGTRQGDKALAAMRKLQDIGHEGFFSKEAIDDVKQMSEELQNLQKAAMVAAGEKFPAIANSAKYEVARMALPAILAGKLFGGIFGRKKVAAQATPTAGESGGGALAQFEALFKGPQDVSKTFDKGQFTIEDRIRAANSQIQDKVMEAEYGRRFKRMTPSRQRQELERQAKEHEYISGVASVQSKFEGKSEMEREQLRGASLEHSLAAQQIRSQIQDMLMGQKSGMGFDGLSRIGGFNAFSDTGIKALTVQQAQLSELRNIKKNTEKTHSPYGR